jgi:hypothetical protein
MRNHLEPSRGPRVGYVVKTLPAVLRNVRGERGPRPRGGRTRRWRSSLNCVRPVDTHFQDAISRVRAPVTYLRRGATSKASDGVATAACARRPNVDPGRPGPIWRQRANTTCARCISRSHSFVKRVRPRHRRTCTHTSRVSRPRWSRASPPHMTGAVIHVHRPRQGHLPRERRCRYGPPQQAPGRRAGGRDRQRLQRSLPEGTFGMPRRQACGGSTTAWTSTDVPFDCAVGRSPPVDRRGGPARREEGLSTYLVGACAFSCVDRGVPLHLHASSGTGERLANAAGQVSGGRVSTGMVDLRRGRCRRTRGRDELRIRDAPPSPRPASWAPTGTRTDLPTVMLEAMALGHAGRLDPRDGHPGGRRRRRTRDGSCATGRGRRSPTRCRRLLAQS